MRTRRPQAGLQRDLPTSGGGTTCHRGRRSHRPLDGVQAHPFHRDVNDTRELLLRWHDGDRAAMAALVEQERDLVQAHIRRRLGSLLRRSVDTQDVVQETMLQALRSAPRFLLSDRNQLRALLVCMVENRLRSAALAQQRQKRDVRRELPLAADAGGDVIDLDHAATATDPGDAAARDDVRAWVRLALELLDADDRDVLVSRDYQDLSFEQIGQETGEAADTVRMRYYRALPKLGRALARLRSGRIDDLLG